MGQIAGYVIAGLAFVGLALWSAPVQAGHSSTSCWNCHAPHRAAKPGQLGASYGVPLWSPLYSADTPGSYNFVLYSSTAFNALQTDIAQPDGPSKLCLGCHDGTYSPFLTKKARSFGPGGEMDFAHSHPLSFTYDAALAGKTSTFGGALYDPVTTPSGISATGSIDADMLYQHKMQCTTCHDVHTTGVGAEMLRKEFTAGGGPAPLCTTCHNK